MIQMTYQRLQKWLLAHRPFKPESLAKDASQPKKGAPLTALDIQVLLNSSQDSFLKKEFRAAQAKAQLHHLSAALWKKWFAVLDYIKELKRHYRALHKKHSRRGHAAAAENELLEDCYYKHAMFELFSTFKALTGSLRHAEKKMMSYWQEMLQLDKKQATLQRHYELEVNDITQALKINLQKELQSVDHPVDEHELVHLVGSSALHPIWQEHADLGNQLAVIASKEANPVLTQELNLLAFLLSRPKLKEFFGQDLEALQATGGDIQPLLAQLRTHPLYAVFHQHWEDHANRVGHLHQTHQSTLEKLALRKAHLTRACEECHQDMLELKVQMCELDQKMQPVKAAAGISQFPVPEASESVESGPSHRHSR